MTRCSIAILVTLTALWVSGCGGDDDSGRDVTLSFAATVGGTPAACGTSYDDLGTSNASGELADARFFASAVELRDELGNWVSLDVADDGRWQNSGVALLDFEDGSAGCSDSGTSDENTTITGTIADGTYDGVRFQVGVPFELNHVDSATAPAPFNVPGMFWVWRGGFKFLRVDFAPTGGDVPRWNIHLGSTMCASDADTTPPESCARSNRPTVELTGFDPLSSTVALDLAALVDSADVSSNVAESPPGCQSNPMEGADCTSVFAALGINFESGECTAGCANQAVFAGQ